ncbi:MAG: hypothetical protein KAS32_21415 [Candidatus Peribacteraceae bacterium]|nr:hypothetical protein [Candidatus Peribacteraceae bacterium]
MKRSDIPTKAVLLACHKRHEGGGELAPWQALMQEFKAPEKVVYAAMERDDERGLIDYGVSIRHAWVTDKGYSFLVKRLIPLASLN